MRDLVKLQALDISGSLQVPDEKAGLHLEEAGPGFLLAVEDVRGVPEVGEPGVGKCQ